MATDLTTPGTDPQAPQLSLEDWNRSLEWEQGEHFTLIGPTGSGKSTLTQDVLLPRRDYVIAFVTKRKDPVVWNLAAQGYEVFKDWRDVPADVAPKIVLAPPTKGVHDLDGQRDTFRRALAAAFRQGGWTVYLDETRYVTDFLGLSRDVELLWHQGRSEGTTVISLAQRPSHIPLLAYSMATHIAFWQTGDLRDLRRNTELGGFDRDTLGREISTLEWNPLGDGRVQAEFLHLNTREKTMSRTLPPVKADAPARGR